MEELRVLSPLGLLGYSFPEESIRSGMSKNPHVIGVDAGSSDRGPYRLATGKGLERTASKRDLERLIPLAKEAAIPLIIGSAGYAGGNLHVDWTLDIIREIAREKGMRLKVAVVRAEVSADTLRAKLKAGKIRSLGAVPDLTEESIAKAARVVAQMGAEPLQAALELQPDIVLAGRSYDASIFAAMGLQKGFPPGLAWHMGRVLECGAMACTPSSPGDSILGILRHDHFAVESLNPERQITRRSVGSQGLSERSNPYKQDGPGGCIDTKGAHFVEETPHRIRISGSQFIPTPVYDVKLEGAEMAGYRTFTIAGVTDPTMIGCIDTVIEHVRAQLAHRYGPDGQAYQLRVLVYGRNAVLGPLARPAPLPEELGLMIDVIAPNQEMANAVCGSARYEAMHFDYPGRIATAGNLAIPFSPTEMEFGAVYQFSLHHLMQLTNPLEIFPITEMTLS